ncbi:MAG TPA: FAD-dependent oxidoreductase [Pseudonocardiaceae bacterium]|jgi:glycine/D-amino acid oxidase-like deaminating enzyme|nr:FAD-dependent oxidoreductase [Pseudonocardiaceae bacterium]
MNPRIAIVGGGVGGAAILEALTRAGLGRPALFEQAAAGTGATGLSGGLMRIYHTDPFLSDLAVQSVPALRKLGRALAPGGYVQAGSLYLEPDHRVPDLLAEVERLRGRCDWPLRVLLPGEGQARFPEFEWAGVGAAVYEKLAGYANPRQITTALLSLAAARGAVVAERTPVLEIETHRGRVTGVRLAASSFAADIVVLAAGAWSHDLLTALGLAAPLRTKRIQYNFFLASAAPRHPAFIDDTTGIYGRPHEPGTSLIGMALDEWDVPVQPAAANPATSAAIHDAALQRVPWLTGARATGGVSGFDAYTPDGHALLEFHDQVEGLFVATGGNGGGFKMALGIGRRVAAALTAYLGS